MTSSNFLQMNSSTAAVQSSLSSFDDSATATSSTNNLHNNSLMLASPPTAELCILRQTSLDVEKYTQNGEQKNVHIVVKNNPFTVDFRVSGVDEELLALDFHKITMEASLVYDCTDETEVVCVRVQPLTYKGIVNERDPAQCKLEVCVAVLSSQHEDMNFKVRFQAINNFTKQPIPHLFIYSEPLQVISKPEVLRKKQQPRGTKKRTKNDSFMEALSRIEETQQKIYAEMMHRGFAPGSSSASVSAPSAETSLVSSAAPANVRLASAFEAFLAAYRDLPEEERPRKVRKLVQAASPSQRGDLAEVAEVLLDEGIPPLFPLQDQPPHSPHEMPDGPLPQPSESSPAQIGGLRSSAGFGCGLSSAYDLDELLKDFLQPATY